MILRLSTIAQRIAANTTELTLKELTLTPDDSSGDLIIELSGDVKRTDGNGQEFHYQWGAIRGDVIQFEVHSDFLRKLPQDLDEGKWWLTINNVCSKILEDSYESGNKDNQELVKKGEDCLLAVRNEYVEKSNIQGIVPQLKAALDRQKDQINKIVYSLFKI